MLSNSAAPVCGELRNVSRSTTELAKAATKDHDSIYLNCGVALFCTVQFKTHAVLFTEGGGWEVVLLLSCQLS